MGILNSNQVLQGARTLAGVKTYAQALVKRIATYSVSNGQVTFANGLLEVEGQDYPLAGTIDFNQFASLIPAASTYLICAVPKYNEPASRSAAETAGLNYYVGSTLTGNESVAYPFLPSAIESAILAKGGLVALQQRVYNGTADASDISVYNAYSEAAQKLIDPRYAVTPLKPIGYEFVVAEVAAQDNSTRGNVLLSKTLNEFNILKSQVPELYRERRVESVASANTRYNGRFHLVESAKSYTTLTDANNDTNGTPIAGPITSFTGTGYVGVIEYSYPSFTAIGQTGSKDKILRILSKKDSSYLGRIDPIYLEAEPVSVRFPQIARSRLTLHADPASLIKVDVTVSGGVVTVASQYEAFETYLN